MNEEKENKFAPIGIFSRDLEAQARARVWSNIWKNKKSMVFVYYLIDIGSALFRSLIHTILWVPAIVIWPLLLSSNGVVKQNLIDWIVSAGVGGWEGALWKLVAAVFVLSLTSQLLKGAVGFRLRSHIDRYMERSLLWNLIETQLPLSSTRTNDKTEKQLKPKQNQNNKPEKINEA